jgi:hypothetical protein
MLLQRRKRLPVVEEGAVEALALVGEAAEVAGSLAKASRHFSAREIAQAVAAQ